MKIYISGRITANPTYEKDFAEAESQLKEAGYEPINPAKNVCDTYREYIDAGLKQLMECDAIYMLSSWELSKGATIEFNYAKTVGMPIMFEG